RAVLEDRVVGARIVVAGGQIEAIEEDDEGQNGPFLTPGFVDVHVHGWGGHDAMGNEAALDGMARALLRHGVTSFVPAAVTSPLDRLAAFADRVRQWSPAAPEDGAEPLGFNIEGPCISPEKKGAQNEAFIQLPSAVDRGALGPMLDGLRIMTVAPERDGALDLVRLLADAGVNVSLGPSNAPAPEASQGYPAGRRTTTHLFNATGVPLPLAVRAASRNPLELIGAGDRGTLAPGQRADLVELDDALSVLRVMKRGGWYPGAGPTGATA